MLPGRLKIIHMLCVNDGEVWNLLLVKPGERGMKIEPNHDKVLGGKEFLDLFGL